MINQNDKDVFEIYNDGVDRILQEFDSCRRFLEDLKKQKEETRQRKEEMEQKHRNELADIEHEIDQEQAKIDAAETEHQRFFSEEEGKYKEKETVLAEEQQQLLHKSEEEIRSCQEKLADLAEGIHAAEIVPQNLLTQEMVTTKTEEFRKTPEEFQKAESRYVKENQDPNRLRERAEREEKLKQHREEADKEAETNALERLDHEINKMETAGDNDLLVELPDIPKAFRKEIKRITDHREELVREDVDALLDGTRRQNETRIAEVKQNHQKNMNKKEQMKTVGRWILCFPINLLEERFSLSKEIVDYGGMGAGIVCSLLMLFNSGLLGLVIAVTVIAGLGYGCLLGMQKRKGGFGMTLGIVQGLGIMVIKILPYPILLFIVTRNIVLWAVWLIVGIAMYTLYDLYYILRKLQPSYRKLNAKYTLERNAYYDKRLGELNDIVQKYEDFLVAERGNVEKRLEKQAADLADLTRALSDEEKALKKEFALTIWDQIVNAFKEDLKQQLEQEKRQEKERLDTLARLRKEAADQKKKLESQEICRRQIQEDGQQKEQHLREELRQVKETAEKELESRKQAIQQDVEKLENKRQQKQKQQQEVIDKFLTEREQQQKTLDQKFQNELNRLTGQMREDGFKQICGFDYREAWAVMYGMLTNLSCYPANLRCYLDKRKKEGGTDVLQKMLAANQGTDEDSLRKAKAKGGSCSCYMPRNILWGAEACGGHRLEKEIQAGLEKVLKEAEEFREISGWEPDQIDEYDIRKVPCDTLYRLKLIDSQDRPLLIYYDLGDLDKDSAERKNLCHYIMKTFVFRPLFYIGNKDYFNCSVLVSDYPEDYKQFEQNPLLQKSMKVIEKQSFGKTLEGLYDRGEKVWKRLKPYGSLYEKNRERCKKGVLPAKDDGYESLIIANMDYKALSNTRLKNLLNLSCQEKGNPCGVYPYLLVDLNRMRNHKDETDKASVDYCRELVKSFQGKCCLLEKKNGEYCFIEKDTTDELYELLGTMN